MEESRAQWTLLTYIAAHNDLDILGQRSLQQILGVGSSAQVKLAVLYDGTSGAARYLAGEPGKSAVEESLGALDSGDPAVLVDTACWAFGQRPAERYGLILWSHGTGWRPEGIRDVSRQVHPTGRVTNEEFAERAAAPGSLALFRTTIARLLSPAAQADRAILFDDGTGHALDTLELEHVAREIGRSIKQPLDFLGMDACLMATVEVAYQLRDSVRCLVASEELVPGFSWPYDQIFSRLRAAPEQSAKTLATAVVHQYADYYTAHPPSAGDVTAVALDLANVTMLATAVDNLGTALARDMEDYADLLWQAQLACHRQESQSGKREPNKFRYHLWDLASLASRLASAGSSASVSVAARAIASALEPGGPAVLAERHSGEWFDGIGGVSIYLVPPRARRISPSYAALALAADTCWDAMLDAYHGYYS